VPFRVAQLYRVMVDALAAGNSDEALVAGGLMAHYVGDACQPLHVSRFHHGRTPQEEGVHSDYETKMVGANRAAIISGLERRLRSVRPKARIKGHRAAAQATVALMDRTFKRIPPEHLCDVWVSSHGASAELWSALGTQTVEGMADGARTLAMLWSSAWAEAGASAPAARAADRDHLAALYTNRAFVPSQYLTEYAASVKW
jgi:hypothetical protein